LSNDDPEAFENLKDKVKEAITRAKSDNATVREFLTNFSKYMQLGDQEIQNEAEIKTNIEAVFSRIKNITLDQTG
jgi:hypothetical protein